MGDLDGIFVVLVIVLLVEILELDYFWISFNWVNEVDDYFVELD